MRALAILGVLLLAACSKTSAPESAQASLPPPVATLPPGDPIEGLRVATRVGCNGCHGKNAAGEIFMENEEVGRVVAPNLTERRHKYDDAALAALLREGRTHDGHPPLGMPIHMFQHLSDAEVSDITAWLRSLQDIANPLPQTQYSAPIAKAIGDGSLPNLDDVKADAGNRPPALRPTESLALGRHLAMTTCTECHGRTLDGFGPEDPTPSLVVVAKAYTPEKFTRLMRTGEIASGGKSKTGMMSGVAAYRFSVMTDVEIAALKQYLDSR